MARIERGLLALLSGAAGPTRTWTAKRAVRWLLKFAEQDLDDLSAAARDKLSEEAMRFTGQSDRLTLPGLKAWQEEARAGFASYFDPRGSGGWAYKIGLAGRVYWLRGEQLVVSEIPGGTDRELFAWFAIVAILAVGRDFRLCANPDCRQAFVADGRQVYCSRLCSARTRLAKFREGLRTDKERREKVRARRKELYDQKQKAKLGPRVKVANQRRKEPEVFPRRKPQVEH